MLLKNWLYNKHVICLKHTPMYLTWSMFLLPFFLLAQINLVQNPSFEVLTNCPNFYNSIETATGWDTLRSGGGGGPEIFSTCANPNVNFGVPINTFGISYQVPVTGNNYALIGNIVDTINVIYTTYREYIQNKLINKTEKNKSYCVSFYLSLTNRSAYSIKEVGMYFDNGVLSAPYYGVANVIPQFKAISNTYFKDTLNWMKVQGVFQTPDTFNYITIGNFDYNVSVDFELSYPTNINLGVVAEYYIDDVSLIPLDTKAYAGRDTSICLGDSVFIGRVPEVGLECQWYGNNLPITKGAGFWAKPSSNIQYTVAQDVCGIFSYDTVEVMLKDTLCKTEEPMPPSINNNLPAIPNIFTPNQDGVNDVWQFNLGIGNTLKSLHIYNRWGNIVHLANNVSNVSFIKWDGYTTSGEPCNQGVYYYTLEVNTSQSKVVKINGYISLMR